MEADVGLQARGTWGLDALFMTGVPAGEVLGDLMSELDQRLSENQTQVEQCLAEITDYEHELCGGTSRQCSNAVDALKQIFVCQLIEQHSCCDVNMDSVEQMLRQLLNTLETVPDSEDAVLKAVLHLASVEGLCLPECSQATEAVMPSVLSLHTAVGTGEQAVAATWNQLRVLLRGRFLERLKQVSDASGTMSERCHLVTSLCALFPQTVIASQYRSIRHLQLDACIDQFICAQGHQKRNLRALAESFKAAVDRILVMMSDDFDLLVAGCLTDDLDEAFQFLVDVYFGRLQDEIGLLVDKLTTELPCSGANGVPRPNQTAESDETTVTKSPSDCTIFSNGTGAGNSCRTQSHGGGNPPVIGSKIHPLTAVHGFTNLHSIDTSMFDTVVSLVDTLLTLDCHVDAWRSLVSSSWRQVVDTGHNKKPRRHLKSALKSRETLTPEVHVGTKQLHQFAFGAGCDCVHNSAYQLVCIGDGQNQLTQSYSPPGNECVPLLKGLMKMPFSLFIVKKFETTGMDCHLSHLSLKHGYV